MDEGNNGVRTPNGPVNRREERPLSQGSRGARGSRLTKSESDHSKVLLVSDALGKIKVILPRKKE